jgi:hypothetical protein
VHAACMHAHEAEETFISSPHLLCSICIYWAIRELLLGTHPQEQLRQENFFMFCPLCMVTSGPYQSSDGDNKVVEKKIPLIN